ncbi:MAG: LOG family protein [Candidatus Woesebacteria bacterium]|nr:LOG family protein [Candidatus Woesebacteria bacterium]
MMDEKSKYAGKHFIKNVAFFGDANISETDETYKAAFDVAEVLAKAGYVIVDGGGPGVMQAATSGAVKGGGKTVSVTFDPVNAPGYEGKYIGNVTDTEVVTTNYIERMFKLIEYGDIFIIFKGGSGTISEFGAAWVLAKLYYGHHKPFILYGDFWAEIIDVFRRNMNIDSKEYSVFEICRSKEEVLRTIQKFETKINTRDHSKDEDGDINDKAFTK